MKAFWSGFTGGLGCMVSRLNEFGVTLLKIVSGPRLQLWALIGAAPVLSLFVYWMIKIAKDPAWPVELRGTQLGVLANFGYFLLSLLALVLVAIASGLITGVKLSGPGGFSAELDTADTVVATTATTVTATASTEVTVAGAADDLQTA